MCSSFIKEIEDMGKGTLIEAMRGDSIKADAANALFYALLSGFLVLLLIGGIAIRNAYNPTPEGHIWMIIPMLPVILALPMATVFVLTFVIRVATRDQRSTTGQKSDKENQSEMATSTKTSDKY
jgi:hypothetical protein